MAPPWIVHNLILTALPFRIVKSHQTENVFKLWYIFCTIRWRPKKLTYKNISFSCLVYSFLQKSLISLLFPIIYICSQLTNQRNCIVNTLNECTDPTAASLIDDGFQIVINAPCHDLAESDSPAAANPNRYQYWVPKLLEMLYNTHPSSTAENAWRRFCAVENTCFIQFNIQNCSTQHRKRICFKHTRCNLKKTSLK